MVGRAYIKDSARGQIIGELASELIHIRQMMNLSGNVRDLAANVFNHPRLTECYKLAALDCAHQLKHRVPSAH